MNIIYIYIYDYTRAKLLQLCLTLRDPMDYSPLCSSVHGILQAKILEWAPISFSRGSFQVRYPSQPASLMYPALASEFFTTWATWEAHIYIQYIYMYICTFYVHYICNYNM